MASLGYLGDAATCVYMGETSSTLEVYIVVWRQPGMLFSDPDTDRDSCQEQQSKILPDGFLVVISPVVLGLGSIPSGEIHHQRS
jgi:hypothetical protein